MTPREIIDKALEEIDEIANDLQQGQTIEEDDALGRRLSGLGVRISNAVEAMTH